MKTKYINIAKSIVMGLSLTILTSGCNDYLDITPPSQVTDADYLFTEPQLAAYTVKYYADYNDYNESSDTKGGMLPGHYGSGFSSYLKNDVNTDNETGWGSSNRFLAGKDGDWAMGQTGGNWNFENIYALNYYLNIVVPRYEAGQLKGAESNIKHYIGEGYFLRAHEYFYRLRKLGDFPIVTGVLPDDHATLTENSKRSPRNEVARFILDDLQKAIDNLLTTAPQGGKTRINQNVAHLLRARVALFEASWLKYHAGTALVPGGQGWTGAAKDYNANYQYPSGSIDSEIAYFLTEAMKDSKLIADAYPLTENNKVIRDSPSKAVNPYYDMFASQNPSSYSEVMMYRQYKTDVQTHWFNHYLVGGGGIGYTNHMEKAFLMENGLPYYAPGSGYSDNSIANTKNDRDYRWQLFMKAPGEVRFVENTTTQRIFNTPAPVWGVGDSNKESTPTGFIHGKGYSLNEEMSNGMGKDATAAVIFRATEAYLIYLEASYMKNSSLDADAKRYWTALRQRAGVDDNFQKTINATVMSKEGENDWGAYSHGALVDATLYNIRRERRCEFVGEGRRLEDLLRWRSLDQLDGFQIVGSKIVNKNVYDYIDKEGVAKNHLVENKVKLDGNGYILPFQLSTTNVYYNGLFFTEAHYLDPINVQHFLITAPDGQSVEDSPIYQNPGWPIENGGKAK